MKQAKHKIVFIGHQKAKISTLAPLYCAFRKKKKKWKNAPSFFQQPSLGHYIFGKSLDYKKKMSRLATVEAIQTFSNAT